jgi:hypothetical protein
VGARSETGRAGRGCRLAPVPLSIVLGGLIFLGTVVGLWRTTRPAPSPAAVVILAARPAGGQFRLGVSWWTATGRPVDHVALRGTVGLLAPWESLAVWHHEAVVAAQGRLVAVSRTGRVQSWPSPDGAVLEVYFGAGQLWVLTARRHGATRLWRFSGRFRPVATVPWGLARFVPGARHPWLLLVRPRDTRLWWPGSEALVIPAPAEGQATAAVGRRIWVPVVAQDRPGLWIGSGKGGRLAREAFDRGVFAVSSTRPPWGFGPAGAVPLGADGPRWDRVRAWPGPLVVPVTPVGTGRRVLVMDGPAEGFWFDVRTGRFEGTFRAQWTEAVVPVAVQLWPR